MVITTSNLLASEKAFTFEIVPKAQQQALFPLIKKMRGENYYHYPYLYASQGADQENIAFYQDSANSLMVTAKQNNQLYALLVAIPFVDFYCKDNKYSAKEEFQKTLGNKVDDYYYISELLFAQPGQPHSLHYEVGKQLITTLEKALAKDHAFSHLAMLVVERPENHPLQVENALDETKILSDLQFVKTQFTTEIPWTTRVSAQKNEYLLNPMRLWTKKIG